MSSRKPVPKRKGGIPLDELLKAQAAGDNRLADLRARYAGSVVPTSTMVSKMSAAVKRPKKTAQKVPEARLGRPDDSQVIPKREKRLVGYARVSTDEQTTAMQRDALERVGCVMIFEDTASGTLRTRPKLAAALAALEPGDTLVVWRLDRLGRSLKHLLEIAEDLQERKVALRSLSDAIDTATPAGRMLYAVLGAVAQFERDVLRDRTRAGMAAAKRRGEHVGRRWKLSRSQISEARTMLADGKNAAYVARVLKVGRTTLYRSLQREIV